MQPLPFLDGEQLLEDLEQLSEIGRNPAGGLDRMAFSPADMEGRRWVKARMQAAGLETRTDGAGNTIGVYAGTEDLPAIVIGSHTDTVPRGGMYDGALGVLAGVAGVRALRNAGIRLRHPVEVINFTAEEATMPGGTMGSQALLAPPDPAVFDQPAWDGQSVRAHLTAAGIDPARVSNAQRDPATLAAFLELHIEQGDTLEQSGHAIGVVEGIVGIRRYLVTFHGYANHAGTTQMARRQDALVAAAPYIPAVRRIAVEHGIVGTVGKLDVEPGAPNVIPGRVRVHVEIRGLDEATLDMAEEALRSRADAAGADFSPLSAKAAVQSDPRLVDALAQACRALDLSYLQMPSGAGHDAMNMAFLCPMAMLFVPSQGGVSHSPDEYTAPEDCVNGARVLLAALLRIDEVV
jgi:N-carbamoyl-L-amino-acid hydrolase